MSEITPLQINEFIDMAQQSMRETVLSEHVEIPEESKTTNADISQLQNCGTPAFDISYNTDQTMRKKKNKSGV